MKHILAASLLLGVFFSFLLITSGCATRSSMTAMEDVFLKGSTVSCSQLVIYQLSEDNKTYIQVFIDTKKVKLSKENVWNLSIPSEGVEVSKRAFVSDVSATLCNDIRLTKPDQVSNEQAISGEIKLTLNELEWQNYQAGRRFKVDLLGTQINFDEKSKFGLQIESASVGWLPG